MSSTPKKRRVDALAGRSEQEVSGACQQLSTSDQLDRLCRVLALALDSLSGQVDLFSRLEDARTVVCGHIASSWARVNDLQRTSLWL